MKTIHLVAILLYSIALSAQNVIVSTKKISDTQGNFTATINNNDRIGHGVTNMGDLDGDGINDIIFGAPQDDDGGTDRGAVYIGYLQANGRLKPTNSNSTGWQKISQLSGGFGGGLGNYDGFGIDLEGLGDLDNDGVTDLLVGAHEFNYSASNFGPGSVWILFMNANGTVKSKQQITNNTGGFAGTIVGGSQFGVSISAIGDLDGDGVTEIAVGSPKDNYGSGNYGAFYVLFLNSNGTVKSQKKISSSTPGLTGYISANDHFGRGITALSDFDGDGINEIAVGSPNYNNSNGAIYIVSLDTAANVKSVTRITENQGGFTGNLDANDQFGLDLATIDDMDGDGLKELTVSAQNDDDGGTDRGAFYILRLNSSMQVTSTTKVSDTQGGFTGQLSNGDNFGSSQAYIGDINGDGYSDYAIGAKNDDDGGSNRGAVWVLLSNLPIFPSADHVVSFNLGCDEIDSTQIWISNPSLDTTQITISPYQKRGFYNGFEGSSMAPFINQNSAVYSTSFVATGAAVGNQYLELTGGNGFVNNGLLTNVFPSTPHELSYRVKSVSGNTAHGRVYFRGQASSGGTQDFFYSEFVSGQLRLYYGNGSGGSTYHGINISSGIWYQVELKNIDWLNKTFDILVNNQVVQQGVDFIKPILNINTIHVYNLNNATIGLDEFILGNKNVINAVTINPSTASLLPSDSTLVTVYASSNGLTSGSYNYHFLVDYSDTTVEDALISALLNVNGKSAFNQELSLVNLDTTAFGLTTLDSISVWNSGCEQLVIDSVYSKNPALLGSLGTSTLQAGDSTQLNIAYTCTRVGYYTDTLFIVSADTVAEVYIHGFGISPNGYVLVDTIFMSVPCTGIDTASFYVYNSGSVNLNYEAYVDSVLGGYIFEADFENGTLDGFVNQTPSLYTTTVVTSNTAKGGKALNLTGNGNSLDGLRANFGSSYPKEISYHVKNSNYGDYHGEVRFSGPDNVGNDHRLFNTLFRYGNLNLYYGNGSGGYTWYTYPASQNTWYHIQLLNINWTSKTFDVYVNGQSIAINVPFFYPVNHVYKVDVFNLHYGNVYVDGFVVGQQQLVSGFVTLSPDTGLVSTADSSIVNVYASGAGLNGGTYYNTIKFNTNDMDLAADSIIVALDVIGIPELETDSTCVLFDTVLVNNTQQQYVDWFNSGCDTLQITGSSSNTGFFSVSGLPLTIPPGDTLSVTLTFSPTTIGFISDSLTVVSNADLVKVCVAGYSASAFGPFPVANFDYTVDDLCDGIVTFSDNTINNPYSWDWDFGDGKISYAQNPIHDFDKPGVYNVRLIAQNLVGADTLVKPVDLTGILYADFGAPDSFFRWQPVQFIDSSLVATSWQWYFGDGGTSTQPNPVHAYNQSGTYFLTFQASNPSCTTTVHRQVDVYESFGVQELDLYSISVFPIPATDFVQVSWHEQFHPVQLRILSMLGKVVLKTRPKASTQKLNIRDLSAGVYTLQLVNATGKFVTERIVIRK